MKSAVLAAILILLPFLVVCENDNEWQEVDSEKIEGVREFRIDFDSPTQVEFELIKKGHKQGPPLLGPETGFTLKIYSPEIRAVDANLMVKLTGHSSNEVYTISGFNDPTNLAKCKAELSRNFRMTIGIYTIEISTE